MNLQKSTDKKWGEEDDFIDVKATTSRLVEIGENGKNKNINEEDFKCSEFDIGVFKKRCSEHLKHGWRAVDSRGHGVDIRFKVEPKVIHLIDDIKNLFPKGYFKSNNNLHRNLTCLGAEIALEFLRLTLSTETDPLMKIMEDLVGIKRGEDYRVFMKDLENHYKNAFNDNVGKEKLDAIKKTIDDATDYLLNPPKLDGGKKESTVTKL